MGKANRKAPRLGDQVCYALYSTSREITKAYKPLLSPLSLTYPQYVVMMALWEDDDIMISQLAEKTGIGNATLTPLLKRLEATGYIERHFKAADERQKLLKLTVKGEALAKKARKASEAALCATGLSDKQARKLLSLCDAIKDRLHRK